MYSRELKPDEKIEAATLVAGSIFRWSHDHENLRVTNYKHEKGSPYYDLEKDIKKGMKLPELMETVREKYKKYYRKGEISLTGPYFFGEDDKAAADKLKIRGVAMEDYHILIGFPEVWALEERYGLKDYEDLELRFGRRT